jgi:hypothetical protein
MKMINCLVIFLLLFFSCTDNKERYNKKELQEDEYGIIFETYNYEKPIGKIAFYLKTDYALLITPLFKNIIDEWKDKWTIEYNIYDKQNKIRYIANDLSILTDAIQNEIPNGIKLYEYIVTTSWLPNKNRDEIMKIIRDISKSKNIEFIEYSQYDGINKIPPEDYIDTFWCLHCMTFIP